MSRVTVLASDRDLGLFATPPNPSPPTVHCSTVWWRAEAPGASTVAATNAATTVAATVAWYASLLLHVLPW